MKKKPQNDFEDRFSFNPESNGKNIRLALVISVLILCIVSAGLGYWLGGGFSENNANSRMRLFGENIRLKALLETCKKDIQSLESRNNVLQANNQSTLKQIEIVQSENTQLKEDLAFFDSLLPANSEQRGIYFRSVSLKPIVGSDKHRLRVLIMQSGSKAFQNIDEFSGNLKFTITYVQNGQTKTLLFPNEKTVNQDVFNLKFKYYKRIDVNFSLPPDALPQKIEFTILQSPGNAIIASHTTSL